MIASRPGAWPSPARCRAWWHQGLRFLPIQVATIFEQLPLFIFLNLILPLMRMPGSEHTEPRSSHKMAEVGVSVEVVAAPEPEPEPEPPQLTPQIRLHQFTEEWQGVRVHGLFAIFTGTRAQQVVPALPLALSDTLPGHCWQGRSSCGSAMIRGPCRTSPPPAATNTYAPAPP